MCSTIDPVADAIRAERARRRMTQHQLAAIAGLSAATIRHYELGRTSPTVADLRRIASALDVHPCALLGSAMAEARPAAA